MLFRSTEQVSSFTYYAHTGFWANKGSNLRAVSCSNTFGDYGLRASGYDITELPDAVSMANNMMQTAFVYKQGIVANEMTPTPTTPALAVWIVGYDYIPTNISELEIDHSLYGESVVRYEVSTIEHTSIRINGQNVLKLNLGTAGNNGTSSTGLSTQLYNGQSVIIRVLQHVKFNGIANVKPTRPSTALQYNDNLKDIYRILSYNLTESTGELLGNNIAILQSDSSFNYYKFVSDPAHVTTVDPDDASKTQGSKIGDNKIAVYQIGQQTVIDQINKGTYITAWNGRTHRVLGYTVPQFIATGIYVSWTSGTNTLVVSNVVGSIDLGDVITGTGFTGAQVVNSVSYNSTTHNTTIVVSTNVGVTTPSGTLTFGVATNGYLQIDPNPVINNSADGTGINAMTYVSTAAQTGSSVAKLVTFNVPYNKSGIYPIVDSYVTIAGNSNSSYNGIHQIVGSVNQTAITISDTSQLEVGMLLSTSDTNAYILDSTIIQSIVDSQTFIVSPACWIPSGTVISATQVAYLASINIINPGSGYTTPPTISFVGGNPVSSAIATCTINNDGNIVGVKVISPGYGYTSVPEVIVTGDGYNGQLEAILSATAHINVTATRSEEHTSELQSH